MSHIVRLVPLIIFCIALFAPKSAFANTSTESLSRRRRIQHEAATSSLSAKTTSLGVWNQPWGKQQLRARRHAKAEREKHRLDADIANLQQALERSVGFHKNDIEAHIRAWKTDHGETAETEVVAKSLKKHVDEQVLKTKRREKKPSTGIVTHVLHREEILVGLRVKVASGRRGRLLQLGEAPAAERKDCYPQLHPKKKGGEKTPVKQVDKAVGGCVAVKFVDGAVKWFEPDLGGLLYPAVLVYNNQGDFYADTVNSTSSSGHDGTAAASKPANTTVASNSTWSKSAHLNSSDPCYKYLQHVFGAEKSTNATNHAILFIVRAPDRVCHNKYLSGGIWPLPSNNKDASAPNATAVPKNRNVAASQNMSFVALSRSETDDYRTRLLQLYAYHVRNMLQHETNDTITDLIAYMHRNTRLGYVMQMNRDVCHDSSWCTLMPQFWGLFLVAPHRWDEIQAIREDRKFVSLSEYGPPPNGSSTGAAQRDVKPRYSLFTLKPEQHDTEPMLLYSSVGHTRSQFVSIRGPSAKDRLTFVVKGGGLDLTRPFMYDVVEHMRAPVLDLIAAIGSDAAQAAISLSTGSNTSSANAAVNTPFLPYTTSATDTEPYGWGYATDVSDSYFNYNRKYHVAKSLAGPYSQSLGTFARGFAVMRLYDGEKRDALYGHDVHPKNHQRLLNTPFEQLVYVSKSEHPYRVPTMSYRCTALNSMKTTLMKSAINMLSPQDSCNFHESLRLDQYRPRVYNTDPECIAQRYGRPGWCNRPMQQWYHMPSPLISHQLHHTITKAGASRAAPDTKVSPQHVQHPSKHVPIGTKAEKVLSESAHATVSDAIQAEADAETARTLALSSRKQVAKKFNIQHGNGTDPDDIPDNEFGKLVRAALLKRILERKFGAGHASSSSSGTPSDSSHASNDKSSNTTKANAARLKFLGWLQNSLVETASSIHDGPSTNGDTEDHPPTVVGDAERAFLAYELDRFGFFTFDDAKERQAWQTSMSEIPIRVPNFIGLDAANQTAYKQVYSVLAALGTFLADDDSSGRLCDSFQGRHVNIGVRRAEEWSNFNIRCKDDDEWLGPYDSWQCKSQWVTYVWNDLLDVIDTIDSALVMNGFSSLTPPIDNLPVVSTAFPSHQDQVRMAMERNAVVKLADAVRQALSAIMSNFMGTPLSRVVLSHVNPFGRTALALLNANGADPQHATGSNSSHSFLAPVMLSCSSAMDALNMDPLYREATTQFAMICTRNEHIQGLIKQVQQLQMQENLAPLDQKALAGLRKDFGRALRALFREFVGPFLQSEGFNHVAQLFINLPLDVIPDD
jgi:hypothetical protein